MDVLSPLVLLILWMVLALAAGGLALAVYRLGTELRRVRRHYQNLVRGADSVNLEEALDRQMAALQQTEAAVEALHAQTTELAQICGRSFQRVGFVRFNPFRDTGGDQSFALALLDGRGDGLVLSSLFSREGTRVYAKPVQGGRSPYTLSDEEQEALAQALEAGSRETKPPGTRRPAGTDPA